GCFLFESAVYTKDFGRYQKRQEHIGCPCPVIFSASSVFHTLALWRLQISPFVSVYSIACFLTDRANIAVRPIRSRNREDIDSRSRVRA
ncbi:hypothetical protein SB780_37390, partial [Burkholderia sp. SIMBA_057]